MLGFAYVFFAGVKEPCVAADRRAVAMQHGREKQPSAPVVIFRDEAADVPGPLLDQLPRHVDVADYHVRGRRLAELLFIPVVELPLRLAVRCVPDARHAAKV